MLRVEGGLSYGARLIVEESCRSGQLIHRITSYSVASHPTSHSIQTGPQTHIDGLGAIAYLNHSCDPNTVVDTAAMSLRAVRDIAAGEELTFFYPSTEWQLEQPFICRCGTPQCAPRRRGQISSGRCPQPLLHQPPHP